MVLALAMLLSLFASCGTGGATQNDSAKPSAVTADTPDAEQTEEEEPTDGAIMDSTEPQDDGLEATEESEEVTYPPVDDGSVTVRYWLPVQDEMLNDVDSADDVLLFREMEKITGVHVDLDLVSQTNAFTTFPLMIASGDHPDMWLNFSMYSYGWDHAVEEDIITPINDYLDEMQNLKAIFAGDEEIRRQCYTDDGYLAGIPAIRVIGDGHEPQGTWMGYALRQDWLDQLDLKAGDLRRSGAGAHHHPE